LVGVVGQLRAQAPVCHRYERDTVSVSGHVMRRVYPGRPNYESVRAGDAPDTIYSLRLDAPMCITASSEFTAHAEVREVQLYFRQAEAATIRELAGRRTTLRGTFTGAVFGWHHVPVLFRVRFPPAKYRGRAA
jgi:hypothetical protein